MEHSRAVALIDQQILDANDGSPVSLSEWRNRTEVVVRVVFGELSPLHRKFTDVQYSPSVRGTETSARGYQIGGVRQAIAILNAAKLELDIAAGAADDSSTDQPVAKAKSGSRIFIVHGQDDARKYELESYLQKLVKEPPVILHQEPNGGRVLIEKIEASSASIGFAVVLLTGDDVGRPKRLEPQDDRPRARQNVVLEMGFFIGLLGRAQVAVLYGDNVELPSDLNGIVYIALDKAGAWKGKLASEIGHAGIDVDWAVLAHV